ncbi:MAG: hypothetical protein KAW12_12710, partial [Candidatus Aminicenantes bacterium]|nr:hypothetical protein [Candidatus Aminicenantes bacterium]
KLLKKFDQNFLLFKSEKRSHAAPAAKQLIGWGRRPPAKPLIPAPRGEVAPAGPPEAKKNFLS